MVIEPVWEAFVLHRERIGEGDISNTVLRVEVPQPLNYYHHWVSARAGL
jgi:hypothetical protein